MKTRSVDSCCRASRRRRSGRRRCSSSTTYRRPVAARCASGCFVMPVCAPTGCRRGSTASCGTTRRGALCVCSWRAACRDTLMTCAERRTLGGNCAPAARTTPKALNASARLLSTCCGATGGTAGVSQLSSTAQLASHSSRACCRTRRRFATCTHATTGHAHWSRWCASPSICSFPRTTCGHRAATQARRIATEALERAAVATRAAAARRSTPAAVARAVATAWCRSQIGCAVRQGCRRGYSLRRRASRSATPPATATGADAMARWRPPRERPCAALISSA